MIKVVLFKRSLKILSGLEGHAQSSQIFNLWSKINDSLFCQFTSLLIIFLPLYRWCCEPTYFTCQMSGLSMVAILVVAYTVQS